METRVKNVTLLLGITKRVPDIAVSMSFSYPGIADCCIKQLLCNCSSKSSQLKKGSHEAALSYAIYEVIRDKFVSSPLELSKTRVSNITCKSIDNHFTISWNCQGTGSSLRKTCGLALSCLYPHKLFSKYSENIRFLSGKNGNKEEFAYCVKKMNEGINKYIQISAVGKISMDATKLKEILSAAVDKMSKTENIGSGSSPEYSNNDSQHEEEYPIIKCSGIAAAATADYIRTNSGGMGVDVCNHGITIYNTAWNAKKKQLSDSRRIGDYIQKKYERLGAEFPNLFAYFVSTQSYGNSLTISKIIKNKQPASKMKELIKDTIKS